MKAGEFAGVLVDEDGMHVLVKHGATSNVIVTAFGSSEMAAEEVAAMTNIWPHWSEVLAMKKDEAKKYGLAAIRKRLKAQMRLIEDAHSRRHYSDWMKGT